MLQSQAVNLFNSAGRLVSLAIVISLGFVLLVSSNISIEDRVERVRAFTRGIEFDYLGWMVDAIALKFVNSSQGISNYIEGDRQNGDLHRGHGVLHRVESLHHGLGAAICEEPHGIVESRA